MKGHETKGRVLLVDDEAAVRNAFARSLEKAGFDVETCADGTSAVERVARGGLDTVVTDISMPGMDGLQLLRAVHARDQDLPVVLITGSPSIQSAVDAVDHGAFKYLVKPCDSADLISAVSRATQLCRLARTKRETLTVLGTGKGEDSGTAGLEATFGRALDSLWMAFQPLVCAADGTLLGYEALLRSGEPSLPHPGAVIDAAERLGQLPQLGRVVRERTARPMLESEPTWLLFINLHPHDLLDPHLLDRDSPLAQLADRVVLEITERTSLDGVSDVRARTTALRAMGFRIAIDDLGAGYAGLSSFVHLEPDFVKLDMCLVRDVEQSVVKRKLVQSMTRLCKEMGLQVVAEGVETAEERDALVELGCDFLQGYRFGKPSRPFVPAAW